MVDILSFHAPFIRVLLKVAGKQYPVETASNLGDLQSALFFFICALVAQVEQQHHEPPKGLRKWLLLYS